MRDATPTVSPYTRTAEETFQETARRDALRWLASQLQWERILDTLRSPSGDQAAQAA
jgi:hypothetical protein